MDCLVHGVMKSQTLLSDFHFQETLILTQISEQVIQTESKSRKLSLNDTLDRQNLCVYLSIDKKSILFNRSTIHILCKSTWNILQDRSHAGLQTKSQ